MRVYTCVHTRKTAVKDAAGAAQRAKLLDSGIFPSPAPQKCLHSMGAFLVIFTLLMMSGDYCTI